VEIRQRTGGWRSLLGALGFTVLYVVYAVRGNLDEVPATIILVAVWAASIVFALRRRMVLIAVIDAEGITFHTGEEPQPVAWSSLERVSIRGAQAVFDIRGTKLDATLPLRGTVPDAATLEQEIRARAAASGVPIDDGR
jgi:hypothetical protein